MTDFLQLVSMLREQMNATMSRSDILRALIWPLGMLLTAVLILSIYGAPTWLLVALATMLIFGLLLYGSSYVFCLIKNPDALRSEKYVLSKMAIKHKLIGDSTTGTFTIDDVAGDQEVTEQSPKRVGQRTTRQIGHKP